jgi:hypothetical protein
MAYHAIKEEEELPRGLANLTRNRDYGGTLVNAAMNLRVP